MSEANTYADLEIRILEKQERGYPVEITFNRDQEFPRGFLNRAAPPLDPASPQESGCRLFQWLFGAPELTAAWAQARGRYPLRRVRLRIDSTAPELHAIPWEMLCDPGDGSARHTLAAMDSTPFSRYIRRGVAAGKSNCQTADPHSRGHRGALEFRRLPAHPDRRGGGVADPARRGRQQPQRRTIEALRDVHVERGRGGAAQRRPHPLPGGARAILRRTSVLYLAKEDNRVAVVKDAAAPRR